VLGVCCGPRALHYHRLLGGMKLLIDENLFDNLVARLSDQYPGSGYVKQLRLHASTDIDIWE